MEVVDIGGVARAGAIDRYTATDKAIRVTLGCDQAQDIGLKLS